MFKLRNVVLKNVIYSVVWVVISLFLGHVVISISGMPIPEGVIGMMILLAFLATGLCDSTKLSFTSNLLVKNIPLLITPVSVGLMIKWDLIESNLSILLASVFGGTMLTLVVMAISINTFERDKD
ncbi:CidA/LrgA family protein [Vibrio neptunius]|nr:CidA/LrgA family protein [Vibrio neptunius]